MPCPHLDSGAGSARAPRIGVGLFRDMSARDDIMMIPQAAASLIFANRVDFANRAENTSHG
jgi:hypothetical protein